MAVDENRPFLPGFWSDDTRMNALFAPFRPKASNLESWNSKMSFWSGLLKSWCVHRNDAIFSENEARIAFARDGRRPACLATLIEENHREGIFVEPSYYMSVVESNNEGWIKWGSKKAMRPMGIALSYVASYVVKKDATEVPPSDRKFVITSVVKHQAEALLSSYPEDVEAIGTIQELMENSSMNFTNEDAFRVILGYLLQNKIAVKKGLVFKLGKDMTSHPDHLSQSEEALWRLRVAVKRLSDSASALEARGEQALKLTKAALSSGDKMAAKAHLRRKHAILERHSKCLDALDNVNSLMEALKQSQTDAQIVHTYRSGVKALKNTMAGNDVSEDTAYSTMDDLKEVLDSCVEIETTIAKPVDNFDIEELEQELADLMNSDAGNAGSSPQGGNCISDKTVDKTYPARTSSIDARKLLEDLPDVPVSPVSSSTEVTSKMERVPVVVGFDTPTAAQKDNSMPKPVRENPVPKPSRSWYPPTKDAFPAELIPEKKDCHPGIAQRLPEPPKVPIDNARGKTPSDTKAPLSVPVHSNSRPKDLPSINDLERRLKGLRSGTQSQGLDLPELDSEDDEAISKDWSTNRRSKALTANIMCR